MQSEGQRIDFSPSIPAAAPVSAAAPIEPSDPLLRRVRSTLLRWLLGADPLLLQLLSPPANNRQCPTLFSSILFC